MPDTVNMVPMNTIILSRLVTGADGKTVAKRVVPEIGKIFAFLPSEVAQIEKANPHYPVLRKPRSDTQGRPAVTDTDLAALQKVAPPAAGMPAPKPIIPGPTPAAKANAAAVAATPAQAAAPEPVTDEDHGL
jgi:hypothetical protein